MWMQSTRTGVWHKVGEKVSSFHGTLTIAKCRKFNFNHAIYLGNDPREKPPENEKFCGNCARSK